MQFGERMLESLHMLLPVQSELKLVQFCLLYRCNLNARKGFEMYTASYLNRKDVVDIFLADDSIYGFFTSRQDRVWIVALGAAERG